MDEMGLRRRRLLRRLVVTGGGLAVASAATAAVASPAEAAAGDEMLLGQANDSGAASTTLAAVTSTAPTLYLDNRGNRLPLRLAPTVGTPVYDPSGGAGQIAMDSVADLNLLGPEGTARVYTNRWATHTVPITPTRVVDTRTAAGRSRIIAGLGNLDSAGRIKAGKTIVFQLDGLSVPGYPDSTRWSALRANFTIVSTTQGGFLTVWGRGSRPGTSSMNWWTSGQVLSNTVLTQLGSATEGGKNWFCAAAVFAYTPTALVVDVAALMTERLQEGGSVSYPKVSSSAQPAADHTLSWE